jgi:predicted phage terminase large subunit-like protein
LAEQGRAPAAHHLALVAELQALARGETTRLMLLLPPGSAKSTFASLLFPAWWMARNPGGAVITASHTARLAEQFGRGVRQLIADHGTRLDLSLRPDARAAGRFLTDQGGEYFAVGVHGAVTGRRADLALIDDPIKSMDQAGASPARARLWQWFCYELITRLKPHGRVVLIMNRWHCDDLAGQLMLQGGWRIMRLPALAEEDDQLGRIEGDALWPEWEPRDALLEKRATVGERVFSALFQQAPLQNVGSVFKLSEFKFADSLPQGETVRAWDLAAGTNESRNPDWTVGVKLVRDRNGGFWVDDVRRVRVAPADLNEFVAATARQDGEQVRVGLPRDPGQAGAYQTLQLTRALAGFSVQCTPEVKSKVSRAQPVATQIEYGHVTLRRASWNSAFLDELAAFPDGTKDDQVDALSRAFSMLTTCATPARFATIPFTTR